MIARKVLITHFSFFLALFVFTTVFKRWFSLDYIPYWLGGVIGLVLPDVDHILYIYFLKPKEAVSQKAVALIEKRDVMRSLETVTTARSERMGLVFHTALFQAVFAVFAFWVVTSGGSLLGAGLVTAFFLHLTVDLAIDYFETGNLANWFKRLTFTLTKDQEKWYLAGSVALLLILALYL